MAVNPWKNGYHLNLDGQFYLLQTDAGKCTLIKSHPQPTPGSVFPPQAPTSFPIHVACVHVQSVSLSLLLH